MIPREEREVLSVEIPFESKQALEDADGPMWQHVHEALKMYFGLDDVSTEAALESEIDEVQEEKQTLQEQVEEIMDRMQDLDERQEYLQEQKEKIEEQKQTYRERIDEILDEMLENPERTVMAWISEIKELSREEYGSASQDNIQTVIGDIRSRRDEQNLAIPDHRFQRNAQTSPRSGAGSGSMQAVSDGGSGGSSDLRFSQKARNKGVRQDE